MPSPSKIGKPPKVMTWGGTIPILALCAAFDAVRFLFEQFWFFGPAMATAYCAAKGADVAGEVGAWLGGALCGTVSIGLSEGFVIFGVAMAMAVGLLGWLTTGLILMTTNARIFTENVPLFVVSLFISEMPFIGSIPALTLIVWRMYHVQIRKEKEDLEKYKKETADTQNKERQQQMRAQQIFAMQQAQLAQAEMEAEENFDTERDKIDMDDIEKEDDVEKTEGEMVAENKRLDLQQLQDTATIGHGYIKKHAENLGVRIKNYSPETVDRIPRRPSESRHTSIIQIRKPQTFHTILREQIHHSSTAKNKTGFRIAKNIDEAIMEKLARELLQKNKDRMVPDFQEHSQHTTKGKKRLASKKRTKELKNLEQNGAAEYKRAKKYMLEEKSFREFIEDRKRKIEARYEYAMHNVADPSIVDSTTKSYEEEIRILDAILVKMAEKRSTEQSISSDKALEGEWRDLQKAYFTGNTFYLKKMEKVLGGGTLRLLSNIDRTKDSAETFKSKTESLLKHIRG